MSSDTSPVNIPPVDRSCQDCPDPADEDDGSPELCSFTMDALREFVSERLEMEQRLQESMKKGTDNPDDVDFTEDWQLSQFWYDERTCEVLGAEILRLIGPEGKVAFISSPTLYRYMRKHRPPTVQLTLLEFDQRFGVFGDDFVLYDYRSPLALRRELREQFDLVVADPPFLSDECLTKTAITCRYLTKRHIILCTGSKMADLATRLLDVQMCKFQPRHANNLANDFCCLASYDLDLHLATKDATSTGDCHALTRSGSIISRSRTDVDDSSTEKGNAVDTSIG